MADSTASGWLREGESLQSTGREEEALAAYEQALRLAPSNQLAFHMLEVRQKLHHPLAPAGHLSADVLDNTRNGTLHGDQGWRTPASFQGAILDGQQGRYQVAERLGDDLLTTSYLARDLAQERLVLVKVLYPRVLFYLATVAPKRLGLNYPYLERLLGYGIEETCCYLVTEYLEGPTLQASLEASAPCAVERAVELAAHIAQGLEALRQEAFSDGGLTTTNILLLGEQGIKLTDLGLLAIANDAWFQDFRLIKPGPWVSNPAYVAPEYTLGLFGAPSKRGIIYVDLYTLACIFFELLSGHPPYPGKHLQEVVFQQLGSPIPSICTFRPDLAPAFDAFFQQALAKQPDDRYQTPQALLQALHSLPGASG
jgi:eukaryotic-like serine/threonine-protein kinase